MVTQVMSDGVENVTAAEVKLYAHYGDETMTKPHERKSCNGLEKSWESYLAMT